MFWFPISLRIKRGYVPIFRLLLFCFASFFFFFGEFEFVALYWICPDITGFFYGIGAWLN